MRVAIFQSQVDAERGWKVLESLENGATELTNSRIRHAVRGDERPEIAWKSPEAGEPPARGT